MAAMRRGLWRKGVPVLENMLGDIVSARLNRQADILK